MTRTQSLIGWAVIAAAFAFVAAVALGVF